MLALTPHQVRLLRLKANRLLQEGAAVDAPPGEILRQVAGANAQDLTAGLLSVGARGAVLTAERVEQARERERSIVWTWCMRGTLHLLAADDARWLIPLLGPALIERDRRRMKQLGWENAAEAGLRLLREELARRGAMSRPEIARLLEQNGLPHEGQAAYHLLYRAALEGIVCFGAGREKNATVVLFEEWLGAPQPLPREAALEQLALRYLEGYGPARAEDLASWSGVKVGEARRAFQALGEKLEPIEAAGQEMRLLKSHLPRLEELLGLAAPARLLPAFDEYLLGYADRKLTVDPALDPAFARRIHPGGGVIHPVVLVDGQAAGVWKLERRKDRLEVRVEAFGPLDGRARREIEAETAAIGRFFGKETGLVIQ